MIYSCSLQKPFESIFPSLPSPTAKETEIMQTIKDDLQTNLNDQSPKIYWLRFKEYWQGISPLSKKLEKMNASLLESNWEVCSENLVKAIEVLAFVKDKKSDKIKQGLLAVLSQLSVDQQSNLIERIIEQGFKIKQTGLFLTCLDLFSIEQLTALAQNKMLVKNITTEGGEAEEMTLEKVLSSMAEYPLKAEESLVSQALKTEIRKQTPIILNILQNVLVTFELAFNPASFIQERPDDKRYAEQLLTLYASLITLPLAIGKLLSPYIPAVWQLCLATTGVVVAGLALLIIYYKWLKPRPKELDLFENLTAQTGRMDPVQERDMEINQILKFLGSLKKDSSQVLIVGDSGVGKTEILKGVAQRIAQGGVPALKGVQLFYANTTKLLSDGGKKSSGQIIEKTRDQIRGYENQTILALDEFHIAAQNETVRNNFKTLLDSEARPMHCICLTTRKEYEQYIAKDAALDRRFVKINVDKMTDDQTFNVLRAYINQSEPSIKFSNKAIRKIVQLTRTSQINISKQIVNQAIVKIKDIQSGKVESERFEKLQQEWQTKFQNSKGIDTPNGQMIYTGLNACNLTVQKMKERSTEIKQELTVLNGLKKQKDDYKKATWKLAAQIKMMPKEASTQSLKKLFIFCKYYSIPILSNLFKEQLKSLKEKQIAGKVDVEFVQEVFEEKMAEIAKLK